MSHNKIESSNTTSRSKSVVMDSNGILRCYNMFPTQFQNIEEMISYLPVLSKMGFNAVWINPIQTAGDVKDLFKRDKTNGVRAFNEVTRSLYAMTDSETISPYFSSASSEMSLEAKKDFDEKIMKQFTDEARHCGLVPMFDLVLNHVSADSRHRTEQPHWFHEKVHPDFKDAIAFDYRKPEIRDEIIEKFWKPYIFKYMINYGFEGVRVDAVGYLEPELRKKIYKYIYELAETYKKPKPVILDELLFNDKKKKLSDVVDNLLLPDHGPTHITRGTYYAHRDEYGGLPSWSKEEEGIKAQAVFLDRNRKLHPDMHGGCIAFSGNHDHNSLAMTILEEMAEQRIKNHPLYYAHKKYQQESDEYDEAVSSVFLYSFVKDIQNEVLANNKSTIAEIERKMREKIVICALTSSAGWYALSGDETGDLLAKPVFRHAHAVEQTYYAQRNHNFFSPEHSHFKETMDVLTQMAIENINKENPGIVFRELSHAEESQKRLLVPYLETLKNQINCGDTIVCAELQKRLAEKNITIHFIENDYVPDPRTSASGWKGVHDMKDFMLEINKILSAMPSSNFHFWSEVIPIQSKPNLVAVVRKNGEGLNSETELVIINLEPSQQETLTQNDIHQIACNFQKRVIPEYTYYNDGKEKHYNWTINQPEFNLAYQTIMSCIKGQKIHISDSIVTKFPSHHVTSQFSLFHHKQSSRIDLNKVEELSTQDTNLLEDVEQKEQAFKEYTNPIETKKFVK
ncbi:alpha-amylase [Legionella gratiana]|uniref:Alpha-amylase n=1 Tax=Legionella gratiana TaxID=45066 RepID=A0A378JBP9_9GAMM|nr:hypothetical protein [Legionella gratiana]KTD06493.1 alpha-amylase [Legionella gratiana]STX45314.1 alpha-amylase [Legionella gratiana]